MLSTTHAPTPVLVAKAPALPRRALRLGWPRVARAALPWLLAGFALAALLNVLFQAGGMPSRAQAALLAVGGFAPMAAGLRAGSLSLGLAGLASLLGFFALAWLGQSEGPVLLTLGFWLQSAWTLSFSTALRWLRAPGLPAGWLGLQLGMALVSVL